MTVPALIPLPETAVHLTYIPERREAVDGKVAIHAPRWRIDGAPTAIMLARRLFDGVQSRSTSRASWPAYLSALPDLEMLLDRYPPSFGPGARDALDRQRGETTRIAPGAGVSRFRGTLRPFQQVGLDFLLGRRRTVLADDMGLGKTPTSLAYLDAVNRWPAVVVCQPHVQTHWERKVAEFLDTAPAVGMRRAAPGATDGPIAVASLRGVRAGSQLPDADLYIVHYLTLHAWAKQLIEAGTRVVVFDECQELRHPNTRKADACIALSIAAEAVVGLSGTPIYNRGPEIYQVMSAIERGCLGQKTTFDRDWTGFDALGKPIVKDPAGLGHYLRDRGLMIRRTKGEVLDDLPEKHRVIEPIDADDTVFAALVKEARDLAHQAAATDNAFDRGRLEQEAITQTRRATGVAKVPAILSFLRGLMEAEEPTLVFSHHHAVHDAIRSGLREFDPVAITGAETIPQKAAAQAAFVRGDTNLCLIALRAASGLDGLQERARVVVFNELDWSPAVHRQGEDRAHRMGQRGGVLAYYLTTDLGTDPFILETLNIKQAQLDGLMHDEPETAEEMQAAAMTAERHKERILAMLRGGEL